MPRTTASPVKIIRPDGTIDVRPAYTAAELRAVRWREGRRSKSSVGPDEARKIAGRRKGGRDEPTHPYWPQCPRCRLWYSPPAYPADMRKKGLPCPSCMKQLKQLARSRPAPRKKSPRRQQPPPRAAPPANTSAASATAALRALNARGGPLNPSRPQ